MTIPSADGKRGSNNPVDVDGDVSTVPPSQKQFVDVEFRAKELIIALRKEGFSGFQIQMIGVLIMNAGQIMAFDAARLGTMVPPLPPTPQHGTVTETSAGTIIRTGPGVDQKQPAPEPAKPSVAPPEVRPPAAAPAAPAPASPPAPEPAKETPPQCGEGDPCSCQICFGVVDENAKKASKLFFNKTLCPACCDKERAKAVKKQQADQAAKSKGAGK